MSPEPSHAELAVSSTPRKSASVPNEHSIGRQSSRASRASSTCSQEQQSPELFPLEDPFANITMQEQQMAYLSPPSYAYSACLPTSDYFTPESSNPQFQQIPQIYTEPHFEGDYTHNLPPTLPSMNYVDGIKHDAYFTDDDFLNPFGISYATLAGMEMPSQQLPSGYPVRVNTTNSFSRQYPHSR